MEPDRIWNVVTNPAWRPLTNSDVPGYVILAVCATFLVGMTLWTYLGSAQTTPRRLFTLVVLRLVALIIAMLTALRPALSVTDQPRLKSTLIVVLDNSESMSITDEYDRLSRWDVLKRNLEKCESLVKQLEEDQQVTVHLYCFSSDFNADAEQYKSQNEERKSVSISDWLNGRKPDGKRTDFGTMLSELYKRYQGETNPLRGLVIVSDGGNNANNPDATAMAMKWRGIGCPIYTFLTGKTDTKSEQKDIAFTSISVVPAPVPIKSDMTVKGTLNAQGLEGVNVKIRLTVSRFNESKDDFEEITDLTRTDEFKLYKPTGNEIEIATKAPDKPGSVMVRLEMISSPAEDRIKDNNQIETFVNVTKDGVRVLVIDRLRLELKYLARALGSDKRFDFIQLVRQTDDALPMGESRKSDVLNEAYDVIILGDVSPARLNAIDPKLMENIAKLVKEKGVGLMMTGGIDSFGGTREVAGSTGWKNTPIEALLPVELPSPTKQNDDPIQIEPLPDARSQFVMRLDPDPKKNKELWDKLGENNTTRLGGVTVIGKPKPTARIYANGRNVEKGGEVPLLVGQTVGNGARVFAFGADQTWKWVNLGTGEGGVDVKEGMKLHARFWKQIVLWLAHQDEVEGNVYVLPDLYRLAVNGKNKLWMGVRDKHGDELPSSKIKMRWQVLRKGEKPDPTKAKPADPEKGRMRALYEPREPGRLRAYVWGEGTDPDGAEIKGESQAFFSVYPEISDELLRPSARDDFLLSLETTANGTAPETARKADKLPSFLQEEMVNKPLRLTGVKPKLHPDWRRNGDSAWFLPVLLVAFVLVLGLEWGLRRVWGMV